MTLDYLGAGYFLLSNFWFVHETKALLPLKRGCHHAPAFIS